MKIITSTDLTDDQKERARELWNAEYPANLFMSDMEAFDNFYGALIDPANYLLINNEGDICGWAALYSIANTRWFFIMLAGSLHGKGYGTLLLNELKKGQRQLFGWVIDHNNDVKTNGEPYLSPLNFYLKNNFVVKPETRLEADDISAVNIVWNAKNPHPLILKN